MGLWWSAWCFNPGGFTGSGGLGVAVQIDVALYSALSLLFTAGEFTEPGSPLRRLLTEWSGFYKGLDGYFGSGAVGSGKNFGSGAELFRRWGVLRRESEARCSLCRPRRNVTVLWASCAPPVQISPQKDLHRDFSADFSFGIILLQSWFIARTSPYNTTAQEQAAPDLAGLVVFNPPGKMDVCFAKWISF